MGTIYGSAICQVKKSGAVFLLNLVIGPVFVCLSGKIDAVLINFVV